MLQAMLLLQENIQYIFQNTLFFETVKFTGQLLELEKVNISPLTFNSARYNIETFTAFHTAAKVTEIFYL